MNMPASLRSSSAAGKPEADAVPGSPQAVRDLLLLRPCLKGELGTRDEQGETMPRSFYAPLSPHEEVTLRRVALGLAQGADLSTSDVRRLKSFALVEGMTGQLKLTTAGRRRFEALPKAARANSHDEAAYGEVGKALTDFFTIARHKK